MPENPNLNIEPCLQLSQRILHSLKLLQMNAEQLDDYIRSLILENPVLEYERPLSFKRKEYNLHVYDSGEDYISLIKDPNNPFDSLTFLLNDQIDRLSASKKQKRICKKLVHLLDKNGYIREEQLECINASQAEITLALSIIQSLEPRGIGARNLSECLLLQLRGKKQDTSVEELLVKHHLKDIAAGNYTTIVKKTGLSQNVIVEAIKRIRKLNPRPAQGYDVSSKIEYIYPDYHVEVENGRIILKSDIDRAFKVSINPFYHSLYKSKCNGDKQATEYLKNHIETAKLLMYQLQQREKTVTSCVRTIVIEQSLFFLNRNGILNPLSLKDVATRLGISQSTVSRSINGRYLQFENQIYPVKYFIARSIINNYNCDVSVQQIKVLIREILKNEDHNNPLTDKEICDFLQKSGISVSRRAVAKYRDSMMIPSSKQRRKP